MNAERPNELAAKHILEHVLGIELDHADKNGGVDYRSADGRIAVEVTRFTDGWKAASRSALRASQTRGVPEGELQNCWLVFASETQSGLNTFQQRVPPLIVQLESAGAQFFDDQRAHVHVLQQGPHCELYLALLEVGVRRASAAPRHADEGHTHQLITTLGGGGTASGSDKAIAVLVEYLKGRRDNLIKLGDSGAEERHLFVWLDDDTRFDVARPLSRDAPEWDDGGFGLPSVPPEIDGIITHLWVVHQRSRHGWLWDCETWSSLEAP